MSRITDKRGNNEDRRRRKHKMLATFGDGTECPCVWCGVALTFETVEADRMDPQRGYAFENVRPACRACNGQRSNKPVSVFVNRAPEPALHHLPINYYDPDRYDFSDDEINYERDNDQ